MSLDYSLPRKSSLSSDSNKTFCMLGHCTPSSGELLKQTRHWSMGTVLLFNGKNTESSLYPHLKPCDLKGSNQLVCSHVILMVCQIQMDGKSCYGRDRGKSVLHQLTSYSLPLVTVAIPGKFSRPSWQIWSFQLCQRVVYQRKSFKISGKPVYLY